MHLEDARSLTRLMRTWATPKITIQALMPKAGRGDGGYRLQTADVDQKA